MPTPEGNPGYLTDLDVRIFLRDADPAANKLLDDYEFTPEEIRTAMTLAVDFWNEEPPEIQRYEVHTFPHRHALLRGTAGNLLFIAANAYRRNKLNYSVPGGGVSDQDKAPDYDAAGGKLYDEFKDWVRRKKRSINMSNGWGSI